MSLRHLRECIVNQTVEEFASQINYKSWDVRAWEKGEEIPLLALNSIAESYDLSLQQIWELVNENHKS